LSRGRKGTNGDVSLSVRTLFEAFEARLLGIWLDLLTEEAACSQLFGKSPIGGTFLEEDGHILFPVMFG